MRRMNCACPGGIDHHSCEGFVAHNEQEYAKAKRLYEENPVEGAVGEWRRLYKKCDYCRFFCHEY